MDVVIWILRIVTCISFVAVIILMLQAESISTVILEGTLFLAIVTSLLGGIINDKRKWL